MKAQNLANDKFQGMCLEGVEGHETIRFHDDLPQAVRKALQNSPFNICAACLQDTYWSNPPDQLSDVTENGRIERYLRIIAEMEAAIRAAPPPEPKPRPQRSF